MTLSSRSSGDIAALNRRIDELRARYTAAVMALRRYGGHEQRCTIVLDDYGEHEPPGCSCGYAKALADAR